MPQLSEDELPLSADRYLKKLLDRRSLLDHFWNGVGIACLALALFLSVYSLILSTRAGSLGTQDSTALSKIKLDMLRDDQREDDQLSMIRKLQEAVASLNATQREVSTMFDCYRTSRLNRASVVTFDGCFVDTTNGQMDKSTGIFTVKTPGIYHISFTAKYVSSSKGRFGAWSDVYVNDTVIADSQREYNGNEISTSESSTHSVAVLYPLIYGDRVKVQFNKDGASYIHSDQDHDVHFIARRVADLVTAEQKKK